MLPWGAQYRNLSTAEGHAWVSACLDGDHQLREARRLAQCALKEVDGGALSSTATLLAYSDGSVLAEDIEGSAAAILCINGREVCAITRLASADRALSSGRTKWGGLVMMLCIAQDVPCEIVLRLDNLQVVNAFNEMGHCVMNTTGCVVTTKTWPHLHGNWMRRAERKVLVASGRCTNLDILRRGKRPLSMINTRN